MLVSRDYYGNTAGRALRIVTLLFIELYAPYRQQATGQSVKSSIVSNKHASQGGGTAAGTKGGRRGRVHPLILGGLSKIHDRNISTLSNACVPRSRGYPFVRQGFLRLSILSEWRTCRLWICHRNLCYVLCHKSGCASMPAMIRSNCGIFNQPPGYILPLSFLTI